MKIQGFRGLNDIELHLVDKTVLIGENNSGKTSILVPCASPWEATPGGSAPPDELDFAMGPNAAQEFSVQLHFRPTEDEEIQEDESAWNSLEQEITQACGPRVNPSRFLQELDLRSKEPPLPKAPHIQLFSVHASKGKEFGHVFLIGLAEGSFPSFHAVKAGDGSEAMEEERRSCYVAITRTRQTLTLAYPRSMNGYFKAPSRFLKELGLVGT